MICDFVPATTAAQGFLINCSKSAKSRARDCFRSSGRRAGGEVASYAVDEPAADKAGAGGGSRTHTTLPSRDFKSLASTSSATSAFAGSGRYLARCWPRGNGIFRRKARAIKVLTGLLAASVWIRR